MSNCLFTKVAGLQSERFSKGDSIHMISWELCKNFNNYLSAEDLRMTGSMLWNMAFFYNCAPINLHFWISYSEQVLRKTTSVFVFRLKKDFNNKICIYVLFRFIKPIKIHHYDLFCPHLYFSSSSSSFHFRHIYTHFI